MKKIIQKRWFKVGAPVFGLVLLIGLSCSYYFGLLLPQKEKTAQLEQISAKIKTYGKLIDIKRSEIKNSENQIDIIENQIELAKLEREELQLKGNDAEKIEEKQKYIEKKEKEKKKILANDKKEEGEYQNLLKELGFDNQLEKIWPASISFNGKEFGPLMVDINEDSKVRTAYYPLKGQEIGESDEELIFNFYIQGVWAGENHFDAEQIASLLANPSKEEKGEILYKFQSPDPINGKPVFYLFSSTVDNEGEVYLVMTKVGSIGDSVFSFAFSKKILESEKDQIFSDFFESNMDKNFDILDIELPFDSLKEILGD